MGEKLYPTLQADSSDMPLKDINRFNTSIQNLKNINNFNNHEAKKYIKRNLKHIKFKKV